MTDIVQFETFLTVDKKMPYIPVRGSVTLFADTRVNRIYQDRNYAFVECPTYNITGLFQIPVTRDKITVPQIFMSFIIRRGMLQGTLEIPASDSYDATAVAEPIHLLELEVAMEEGLVHENPTLRAIIASDFTLTDGLNQTLHVKSKQLITSLDTLKGQIESFFIKNEDHIVTKYSRFEQKMLTDEIETFLDWLRTELMRRLYIRPAPAEAEMPVVPKLDEAFQTRFGQDALTEFIDQVETPRPAGS